MESAPFLCPLQQQNEQVAMLSSYLKVLFQSTQWQCWFIQLIGKITAKKLFLTWLLRYFSSLTTWWLWVLSVHKRIEMRKCDIFKILKIILTSSRQKESIWKMQIKGKMVGKIRKRQPFAHSFLGINHSLGMIYSAGGLHVFQSSYWSCQYLNKASLLKSSTWFVFGDN